MRTGGEKRDRGQGTWRGGQGEQAEEACKAGEAGRVRGSKEGKGR